MSITEEIARLNTTEEITDAMIALGARAKAIRYQQRRVKDGQQSESFSGPERPDVAEKPHRIREPLECDH